MSTLREVLTGIFAALTSIIIIAGSFAIATTEGRSFAALNTSFTPTLTSFPTHIILVTQRPGEPTYTPSPTPLPSITPTTEVSISCQPPKDWSVITLQPGDTLESLAQTYNTTPDKLKEANCLVSNSLAAGTTFYVPGAPPPTQVPCGPPPGWEYYIVQKGDTLYSISRAYGVSVSQLQAANCLGSSTTIRVGQKLHVPNVRPILPSLTPTLQATPTPQPSSTQTQMPPSPTSTVFIPSASPTLVPPTFTPSLPTETATVPTQTPVPSDTPIPPTLTFTATPEPTTMVPTSTILPTNTPVPIVTYTFTPEPIP